jgi:excinuclease ABC subunit B
MQRAAAAMDFEEAARLRDEIVRLRVASEDVEGEDVLRELKKTARKGSAFGNRKNAAYGSARRS